MPPIYLDLKAQKNTPTPLIHSQFLLYLCFQLTPCIFLFPSINICWKWWDINIGIEIMPSQWMKVMKHGPKRLNFFSFCGRWGGVWIIWFFIIPIVFPMNVLNNTLLGKVQNVWIIWYSITIVHRWLRHK